MVPQWMRKPCGPESPLLSFEQHGNVGVCEVEMNDGGGILLRMKQNVARLNPIVSGMTGVRGYWKGMKGIIISTDSQFIK